VGDCDSAELPVDVDRPLLGEVVLGRSCCAAVAHIAALANDMAIDHFVSDHSPRRPVLRYRWLKVDLDSHLLPVLLAQMEIVRYQARYCTPWHVSVMLTMVSHRLDAPGLV